MIELERVNTIDYENELLQAADKLRQYCTGRKCDECLFMNNKYGCVIESSSPDSWKLESVED